MYLILLACLVAEYWLIGLLGRAGLKNLAYFTCLFYVIEK